LNFSLEESDAAIARFGCDCTTCISSVRQLRGQAPLRQLLQGEGQGQRN
jgi:hypothetical protein